MSKARCKSGWSADECGCLKPSRFCKAKLQWVLLAIEEGRDVEAGAFGLVHMMKASEWDLTGLVMKVEIPGTGNFRIGKEAEGTMTELANLSVEAEAAKSVLLLLKSFPGAKMEFPKDEGLAFVEPGN